MVKTACAGLRPSISKVVAGHALMGLIRTARRPSVLTVRKLQRAKGLLFTEP